MKVSENFELEEFVPHAIYELYKDKSIWFIDYRCINFAELILKHFKIDVTINNWHQGGSFQDRGFRAGSITNYELGITNKNLKQHEAVIYNNLSQHNFGRAIDFNVKDVDPEDVRQFIRDNFVHLSLSSGVAAIETGISWVHVDFRQVRTRKLLEIKHESITN